MISIRDYVRTTSGKKTLVGLTGLAVSLFALSHMAGNMLILVGPEAYNHYSHALVSNPLIYVAEIGLIIVFGLHIFLAANLFFSNRIARPGRYYQLGREKSSSFAARTMILSGALLLVFLVLHLATFKYGPHYSVIYNGVEMRDIYRLVIERFRSPAFSAWYVFSLLVLGLHLSHGFSATFQSLGFLSAKNCCAKRIGWIFAVVVAAGFISQPLYVLLTGGK